MAFIYGNSTTMIRTTSCVILVRKFLCESERNAVKTVTPHFPLLRMWWGRLWRQVNQPLDPIYWAGSEQITTIPAPIKPPVANLNTILGTDDEVPDTETGKENADITRTEGDHEFLMMAGGDHHWGKPGAKNRPITRARPPLLHSLPRSLSPRLQV